jgi:RNA polymerase sigma-70 factor (ECF subfamily)
MVNGPLGYLLRHVRQLAGGRAEELTDGQLLARFADRRDEDAFAALVERHGRLVLGVCRRLLDGAQDVEDAFQGTFLVLARKAGAVRKCESVGSWLYGVAYRVAARARAEAARRRARERQAGDMAADPVAEPAWRELRPVLDEELRQLPAKYRMPLVLCYLEGKTHEEAARELGWPAGSMSRRLGRARELLRGRLVRRGLTPSAGPLGAALAADAADAAVPAAVAAATVRAAARFAVGNPTTGGAVSAQAAALAEGVLQAMFITKVKIVAAVLAAAVLAGTAAGVLISSARPGAPTPAAREDGPKTEPRAPAGPNKAAEDLVPTRDLLDQADRELNGMDNDYNKARALSHLGVLRARAGDRVGADKAFAQAGQVIDAFKGQQSQATEWRELAKAQAKAGDVKGALQTIESIGRDEYWKGVMLGYIGKSRAEAGAEKEALDLAARQSSPTSRPSC